MKSPLLLSALFLMSAPAWAQVEECQSGPGIVGTLTRADDESLTCLDSLTESGKLRALVLSTRERKTASGGREELNALRIVSATLDENKKVQGPVEEASIADPSLFPRGCGQYLKGGRLLPGLASVALIYSQKIVTVDYSNETSLQTRVLQDRSIPGIAYTCEGYIPNWDAGREGLKIDGAARTITLTTISRKTVEKQLPVSVSDKDRGLYHRAYDFQCGPGAPAPGSQECQDLKRAFEEGVFTVRKLEHPQEITVLKY